MSQVDQRPGTVEPAQVVVTAFFERHRLHDVEGMTDLCSLTANLDYVPVEFWGKQRVQRGQGKVGNVGKVLWHGLISSFPDLSLSIHTIHSNTDGDVVVEADFTGTQGRA